MLKKKFMIAVIVFTASAITLTLILGSLNWRKYNDLVKMGIPTEARIVTKEPDNHLSVRYSYIVNQQDFSGLESVGRKRINGLNVGDNVRIYYLPTNPAISCFCDPREKLINETQATVLAAVFGSLIIVGLVFRKLRLRS